MFDVEKSIKELGIKGVTSGYYSQDKWYTARGSDGRVICVTNGRYG